MGKWEGSDTGVPGRLRAALRRELPKVAAARVACLSLILSALHLTACSESVKTVSWEEEVRLGSGQILWVHRTDSFKRKSEPGNPLRSAWWPTRRALEFTWRGQRYEFATDTTSIMMLHDAEAPGGLAVIAWTKNCARPGYGEFRWANGAWRLQPTVSPATIGKARNLMDFYSAVPGEIPPRATIEFKRNSHFELPQKGGEETHLQESRIANNCSGTLGVIDRQIERPARATT